MKNVVVLNSENSIPEIINYCRWEISQMSEKYLNKMCDRQNKQAISIDLHGGKSFQFIVKACEPDKGSTYVEFIGSAK